MTGPRRGRSRWTAMFTDGSRSLPRGVFPVVLGSIMVVLAVALYATYDFDDEPEDVPGMEGSGERADAEVGPPAGTDLAGYLPPRAAALAEAEGERVAIVSFVDYLTEHDARAVLDDVTVGVLLVAFPGDSPVPTADLDGLRDELVAEAEEQLPELRSLLPTVDDPEFSQFYASEIERYEGILAAGNTPDVVYGAIVRAGADALRALDTAESVRLVDVGDSDVVTHGAALAGLRPEETAVAGDPPTRPAG